MEELVVFLREVGIDAVVQEAWEHNRVKKSAIDTVFNMSWAVQQKFDAASLEANDPPQWLTEQGAVSTLFSYTVPDIYAVLIPWTFHCHFTSDRSDQDEGRGWIYGPSFDAGAHFSSVCTAESKVRKRKWQQLIVRSALLTKAKKRLESFVAMKPLFRTLNEVFLQCALRNHEHFVQYVLECQRRDTSQYHSIHLLPSDPPTWCCGADERLYSDPRLLPVSSLLEVKPHSLLYPKTWHILHDFIFTVYPNRDECGWEYASDFSSSVWTPSPQHDSTVRRRLWIRTIVRNQVFSDAKNHLQAYIASHPRGVIKRAALARLSHYRKNWNPGTAVLRDSTIALDLADGRHVTYSLLNAEVCKLAVSGKYAFGLRRVDSEDTMICHLSAPSEEERQLWILILSLQLALLDINFKSLSFGPPIGDQTILKGYLCKQGHVVTNWKQRHFELRQDGTLAYFKSNALKGKVNITNCTVNLDVESERSNSFEVVCTSGYSLLLSASSEESKEQWVNEITTFTATAAATAPSPVIITQKVKPSIVTVSAPPVMEQSPSSGHIADTDSSYSDMIAEFDVVSRAVSDGKSNTEPTERTESPDILLMDEIENMLENESHLTWGSSVNDDEEKPVLIEKPGSSETSSNHSARRIEFHRRRSSGDIMTRITNMPKSRRSSLPGDVIMPTHFVRRDAKGRRRSVLQSLVLQAASTTGYWEAEGEEDESDEEDDARESLVVVTGQGEDTKSDDDSEFSTEFMDPESPASYQSSTASLGVSYPTIST